MAQALEVGTYEVIRDRLQARAADLRARLKQLNAARQETFGTLEFKLSGSDRITTEHNCTPRDMVALGDDIFLFGYNVQFGLKTETDLGDVFALYEFQDGTFHPLPLDRLRSRDFESDFKNLYKYYRHTTLAKFRLDGPHLYMAFQVGKSVDDLKTFKWLVEDGQLTYLGNRFDHEFKFPPLYQFEWKRATRDSFRTGKHPHVSIEDQVFVNNLGGTLTIKSEDNTSSGTGLYEEPVENRDQTLDDAEILYARLGHLTVLKIKPYQERNYRHFIYNRKAAHAVRLDPLGWSCALLPEDQGLIFPGGYYLATGDYKVFDGDFADMIFSRRIDAPNGEDSLYVFYQRASGTYAHLSYNRITQQTAPPQFCHGYALFPSGRMFLFRAEREPQKHHTLQIWQTPYLGRNVVLQAKNDSFLAKLGNATVVSALAEANEVLHLLERQEIYDELYLDLIRRTTAVTDAYFWLGDPAAFGLKETLLDIKAAAGNALDEFAKVRAIQKSTASEIDAAAAETEAALRAVVPHNLTTIDHFVTHLATLRGLRGRIISLKDLRYADLPRIEDLEQRLADKTAELSKQTVAFLLDPAALAPYQDRIAAARDVVPALATAAGANALQQETNDAGQQLEMLIEVVSGLDTGDATETTRIIESISALYGSLNQVRAAIKNRRRDLQGSESAAQFAAQIKLLEQSTTNFLDLADSPAKCDEFLSRLTLQLEELEGRYTEFDDHLAALTEKREEIYSAFEARKVQLQEARGRRAATLAASAERLLATIRSRVDALKTLDEINGYLASDLMVAKVRDTIDQLLDMGESVKADELQSRLKTLQQDAVRQLKDRLDLFTDGGTIIKLGPYHFTVNSQPLDLAVVPRGNTLALHISGTNFFEPLADPALLGLRDVWDLEFPSESPDVYRAEFLAFALLTDLETRQALPQALRWTDDERLEAVRTFMAPRYREGYVKGVHDADAALLLSALLRLHHELDTLRYPPAIRALARLAWATAPAARREPLATRLASLGQARTTFPSARPAPGLLADLHALCADSPFQHPPFILPKAVAGAAAYLLEELTARPHFLISREALNLADSFTASLKKKRAWDDLQSARRKLQNDPPAAFALLLPWLEAHARNEHPDFSDGFVLEAATLLHLDQADPAHLHDASRTAHLEGLHGTHPCVANQPYPLDYHAFIERLARHQTETVPRFEQCVRAKHEALETRRRDLRLEGFKPKVLSSFVRSRLIDEVYLPLVGANLAKQIGVAGENKRTDRMGLLLLISPPGYGKTTLIEYVAHRLGLVFMKINGPALGHGVTSLDPADAPNAAAREEIVKLNLALEMGDNVLLCVDDIQHCNPEFLQKFISLCDAQRRIEGVWNGQPRTYDLRGRKVAVVMAGNPYTESGDKFNLPDMLANRADTYNLGDIIGANTAAFEQSYLENCVTSNPVLSRLAARGSGDVRQLIRIAETGHREGARFEGNYSAEELEEMIAVMTHLVAVRKILLRVNREYIHSAAQTDAFRTEPPFKLQGSYRTMNRLAEKILPIMTAQEVEALLLDQYKNDAQTLATGAEANLLKLREMLGLLTPEEAARWDEIKRKFQRNQLLAGVGDQDPVGKVVGQLALFHESLEHLRGTLAHGFAQAAESSARTPVTLPTAATGPATLPGTSAPSAHSSPAEETNPVTVEVRYGVPETFTSIIEHQFELMQAWTKQAFGADKLKTEELKFLNVQINSLAESYKLLIENLRKNRVL